MSKDSMDVVGIGNAIVDVLTKTEDNFLAAHRLNKGTMTLIEAKQAEELYEQMGPAMAISGGSAANTIAALSSMGGDCGFIGKVANDQLGNVFRHDICATGVKFVTHPLEGGPPTARCLILVTPDAQRTMCTFLGACVWISQTDLDEDMIKNAKYTYLEGYLFDPPRAKQAFRKAGELAHGAGKKVALTLSDPFCVDRHRDEFLDLVQSQVDVLFANEAEITSLYKTKDFNEAVFNVRQNCQIAALTRSEKGSVIVTKDEIIEIPAAPVAEIVDTTGAGDLYAAGFLYGLTHGKSLAECGHLASRAAAEVLGHMGARPQYSLAKIVQERKAV